MGTVSATVAILALGVSTHLTDDNAPKGGYNEFHKSFGIEVTQEKDKGWVSGGQAMVFEDSFAQDSMAFAVSHGYKFKVTDNFSIKTGVFGGYLKTSYYDGMYGNALLEPCYKRLCGQISYVPKIDGGDEVLMFQGKIIVW